MWLIGLVYFIFFVYDVEKSCNHIAIWRNIFYYNNINLSKGINYNAKAADNIVQCAGCGSKEFKNICINCGTIFLGNKCSSCGVMIGDKPRICFNCGKKTFATVCPDCGADLISRRKVQVNPYPTIVQQRPKKKSKISAVLITLFFTVGFSGVISSLNSDKNTIKVENNSETVSRNLSYVELLTLKEHPKFYGDYQAAKSFWKGFDKVKVVNARQTIYNEDALLLVTTGDEDNDVITNVTINLSDYEKEQYLELDNVMQLICDYIPYDIIDKYYDFKESFHEIYKDGGYEAYHYVMELNDKGKEVNKSGERYFNSKFAFKIMHRNDNDWIAVMNYLAYKGNHNKFRTDAYDVEEWDVNIEKYKN